MYNSFEHLGLVRVLRLLQSHREEYLSGRDISDVLGISRVTVWKRIKKIREMGYTVEAKQKLGYMLISDSPKPLPWEIVDGLDTSVIGKRAYYADSVDSTQKVAMGLASDPANDGAVVLASRQTGGVGRRGSKWSSPEGGVWMSVILHPEFDISVATLFPIAVSVSLAQTIEKMYGISPELKWPNDLTIGGRKVAGVLVDASLESNRIKSMVAGIGVNLDVDTRRIEDENKASPGFYGAASLHPAGGTDSIALVRMFITDLEEAYLDLLAGRRRRIVSEWTKRSSTIGKTVMVETAGRRVAGRALRIDEDGALVVSSRGRDVRVISGQAVHQPGIIRSRAGQSGTTASSGWP